MPRRNTALQLLRLLLTVHGGTTFLPSIDPYLSTLLLPRRGSHSHSHSVSMLSSCPRLFFVPSTTSSVSARLLRGAHKIRTIVVHGAVSRPVTLPVTLSRTWKAAYSCAAADMETVDTSARLSELRRLMKDHELDIYGEPSPCQSQQFRDIADICSTVVVPSEDSHSSEYIAPCDARREFICGFSGSAGCAVITHDKAALATDGRYFNQATKQLDNNWTLLKQGLQDVPTWQDWCADESAGGKYVGVDPTLLTSSTAEKLIENIERKGGSTLIAVRKNLVDIVWGEGKPPRPNEPVKLLRHQYSGKDTRTKLHELRKELKKKQLDCFVVSMLDEVAWLFNLRGNDIPYNPVFFSYAVVTANEATLYIDSAKLDEEAHNYLAANSVTVKPYDSLFEDASALSGTLSASNTNGAATATTKKFAKFATSTKGSWALKLALDYGEGVEEIRSPVGDSTLR